jgi:hypothetical protein
MLNFKLFAFYYTTSSICWLSRCATANLPTRFSTHAHMSRVHHARCRCHLLLSVTDTECQRSGTRRSRTRRARGQGRGGWAASSSVVQSACRQPGGGPQPIWVRGWGALMLPACPAVIWPRLGFDPACPMEHGCARCSSCFIVRPAKQCKNMTQPRRAQCAGQSLRRQWAGKDTQSLSLTGLADTYLWEHAPNCGQRQRPTANAKSCCCCCCCCCS